MSKANRGIEQIRRCFVAIHCTHRNLCLLTHKSRVITSAPLQAKRSNPEKQSKRLNAALGAAGLFIDVIDAQHLTFDHGTMYLIEEGADGIVVAEIGRENARGFGGDAPLIRQGGNQFFQKPVRKK